jgi:hypothetical protein
MMTMEQLRDKLATQLLIYRRSGRRYKSIVKINRFKNDVACK